MTIENPRSGTEQEGKQENPVDAAQTELDQAQEGALEQPSTVSRADFDAMKADLLAQVDAGLREMRGLQSKLDKDRKEALLEAQTREAEARVAQMRTSAQALDDPNQQALWQAQADLEQARINQARHPDRSGEEVDTQGQEDQVRQVVRNYGLNPDDPLVDYASLNQPGLNVDERQQRFFQSLQRAHAAQTSAVSPAPPSAPSSQPAAEAQVVTPSANAAPSPQGGIQTEADLHDAFISGRISLEEYRTTAASRGWQV